MKQSLTGEIAPDMSEQQLKKQSAPPKRSKQALSRKRAAAPTPKPAVKSTVTLAALPTHVQQVWGWDPRVTLYFTDEKALLKIERDKNFSRQSPDGVRTLAGWTIEEVGALFKVGEATKRIVRVKEAKA